MAYYQNGGTQTLTGGAYSNDPTSSFAIHVLNQGTLFASGLEITIAPIDGGMFDSGIGVLAETGSFIALDDTIITVAGSSTGIEASGTGTTISMVGGKIANSGTFHNGVYADSGATAILRGTTLTSSTMGRVYGLDAFTGFIDAEGVTIAGMYATAISDSEGTILLTGGTIANTTGGIADIQAPGLQDDQHTLVNVSNSSLAGVGGLVLGNDSDTPRGQPLFDPALGAETLVLAHDTLSVSGTAAAIIVAGYVAADISLDATTLVAANGTLVSSTTDNAISLSMSDMSTTGEIFADQTLTAAGNANLLSLTLNAASWTATGTSVLTGIAANPLSGAEVQLDGTLTVTGSLDATVATKAGTENTLAIGGGDFTVDSAGTDAIDMQGGTGLIFAAGDTTVLQEGGTLTLVAGVQSETFGGDLGADTIFGGSGGGYFRSGSGGGSVLVAGSGETTLAGGGSGDVLYGGSGTDVLVADTDHAILVGGSGADTMFAGANGSDDTIFGGSASTLVLQGTGDVAVLGAGNVAFAVAGSADIYAADGGGDTIFGGAGSLHAILAGGIDTIEVVAGHAGGSDLISHFANGTDRLDFSGYGSGDIQQSVVGGNTVFTLSDHTVVTLVGITDLSSSSLG